MSMGESSLRIGGFTPLTTVDFPGQLSAVLFCQACPWRCAYCHNDHLQACEGEGAIAWSEVSQFLAQRRGLLDAVVFSGGEPLAQRTLRSAIETVRAQGFKIGLHTAGIYPDRFAEILPLCDWVGFDLKTDWAQYASLTGSAPAAVQVAQSLELLLASGVCHEIRTTVHSALLTRPQLQNMAIALAEKGVRHWQLQVCRTLFGAARGLPENDWSSEDQRWVQSVLTRWVPSIAVAA